MESVKKS
jgi:hypothetical protein